MITNMHSGATGVLMQPSSGPFGYWTRTLGTPNTLQPRYANDVVLLSDGAVGDPGLAFVAETDSGLYRAGANDVRLSVNGADAIQATAALVQIGAAGSHKISCPGPYANCEQFGAGAIATTTYGGRVTAVGANANAGSGTNNDSTAIGANSTIGSNGPYSTIVGAYTVGKSRSTVLGAASSENYGYGIVLGYGAIANAAGQIILFTQLPNPTVIYGRGNTHAGAAQTTTHRAANGSGTDVVGDNTRIQPGLGTGAATTDGTLFIATGEPLGTGTTLQTATDRMRFLPGGPVAMLASTLVGASGANIGLGDANTATYDAATTTTFTAGVDEQVNDLTFNAEGGGGGAYTVNLDLLLATARIQAGNTMVFHITIAATTDPTVMIRNGSGGGTIFTVTGGGSGEDITVICYYNGTAWIKLMAINNDY